MPFKFLFLSLGFHGHYLMCIFGFQGLVASCVEGVPTVQHTLYIAVTIFKVNEAAVICGVGGG
jgi:hypothetical protein